MIDNYTQIAYNKSVKRSSLWKESIMDIKKLREQMNMSQSEFANFFGFNIDTLQNWEQGRTKTPSYVFTLLFKIFDLEARCKNLMSAGIR